MGDIVEENGKSVKENNLEKKHNIPIGSLVEVKYDNWYGNGACQKVHARLYVVEHTRDCDGTPLYSLSPRKTECHIRGEMVVEGWAFTEEASYNILNEIKGGFAEESLSVVPLTAETKEGHDSLYWER